MIIQIIFNIFFKFLIILKVYSKLIKFIYIVLELRYRYNSFESFGLLIEFLENYFELLITSNTLINIYNIVDQKCRALVSDILSTNSFTLDLLSKF